MDKEIYATIELARLGKYLEFVVISTEEENRLPRGTKFRTTPFQWNKAYQGKASQIQTTTTAYNTVLFVGKFLLKYSPKDNTPYLTPAK